MLRAAVVLIFSTESGLTAAVCSCLRLRSQVANAASTSDDVIENRKNFE